MYLLGFEIFCKTISKFRQKTKPWAHYKLLLLKNFATN